MKNLGILNDSQSTKTQRLHDLLGRYVMSYFNLAVVGKLCMFHKNITFYKYVSMLRIYLISQHTIFES